MAIVRAWRMRVCVVIALAAMLGPAALSAAPPQPDGDAAPVVEADDVPGPLRGIPGPAPILIRPRVFTAYAALITAGMLALLYLYRGRPFIVYWIASWGLVAGALGLVARAYDDLLIGKVLTGLAMLLVVWACGLMLQAIFAFQHQALRWGGALRVGAATAVWFLVSPFFTPLVVLLASATALAGGLLGWAAFLYLQLARRSHYAGAFLIGAGLVIVCAGNLLGVVVSVTTDAAEQALSRIAGVNVVTSIFIALGMHLLVFEDMTAELRRANHDLGLAHDEVKRLAITDPLTGCHNRRFFDEIERREMQRHRRYGAPLSVVFVDVNHFKRLNDSFGHDRGDDVLRALGTVLRRQVRESDYVIRWGGDEFLLLMACAETEAQTKAMELKVAFARERAAAALPDDVGLSIGVAPVAREAESLREAIREADGRMYRDKLSDRTQT